MTRKLKALGLALLALGAMGAIAAQAASATNHEFEATKASVVLTGNATTNQVFTVGAVAVVCPEASFVGTQAEKTVDHVKVKPEYFGHCVLGSTTVHVTNKGCEYTFDSDTTEEKAKVSVVCGHTGSITITDSGGACVIHVADTHTNGVTVNQNLSGVTYKNVVVGNDHDVVVVAKVPNIAYEATGFGCFLLGIPSTGVNGEYTGSATVRGYEDVGAAGENKHNNVLVSVRVEENTPG